MRGLYWGFLLSFCGVYSNDLPEHTSQTHPVDEKSLHIRHVFRESIPRLSTRQDLSRQDRLHRDYVHQVIFVIRQKNMDKLTEILHDISNPSSDNYGKHMTKEEIRIMTSNQDGHDAVMSYLQSNGVTVFHDILEGEFITASAPIFIWEKTFDTEFFSYHQRQRNGDTDIFVRADKYSVPIELDDHLQSVFNTIQLPYQLSGDIKNFIIETEEPSQKFSTQVINAFITYTTPQRLRTAYNMSDSAGSIQSTQAVYATIGQHFSPTDLSVFQKLAQLPNRTVASVPYGFSSDKVCRENAGNCVEGNLDIQYIMSMSPISPTTYWYSNDGFMRWLFNVAVSKVPPLVLSISYGADESLMSNDEMENFMTFALKLSTAGTTIVVASGDDGAVMHAGSASNCGYSPSFPSTCPYVTSVGATQGIERGTAEIVCQVGNNCTITSGGGFSNFFPEPLWQSNAIGSYLSSAKESDQSPVPGYAVRGRGYPDVAFAGSKFLVRIGGKYFGISGTSASAPGVAGMFSNLNAARMAIGKGSIGWVNPALYTHADSFVNDITSGHNKCAADGMCCPHGFTAGPGWDPVSGLGTLNYGLMSKVLLGLGTVNSALYFPSFKPVFTPRPTSSKPSIKPFTYSPSSGRPSRIPTGVPSRAPTESTFAYMEATQSLSGITLDQAKKPAFITALRKTLLSSMGAPDTAVVNIDFTSSGRRLLASNSVKAKYDIAVESGLSEAALLSNLQLTLNNGAFIYYLKANTGMTSLAVKGFALLKISPTHLPSAAPVEPNEKGGGGGGSSGNKVTYPVVGAGLAIFFIIGAVTFYCRRVRKNAIQTPNDNGPQGAIARFDAHSGRQIGGLSGCEVTGRGLTRQPTLDEYGLPGPSEPVYDSEPTTNDASGY